MNTKTWRLGSGVILWFYIALHLLNHSMGLISLAAAERGMGIAVLLWHSGPGTTLLYGALVVHLWLALGSLYRRPTLRMPPMELLRIAFGLGFPLLLVGHAVSTRVAFEWYGLLPQYQRVVGSLVSSGSEGRQLALLAPGWAHGCMGLSLALRQRGLSWGWQKIFIVFAVLLPLAGAGGFLAMDAELAHLVNSPAWKTQLGYPNPEAQAARLGLLRDQILTAYLGLLLSVLVARLIRILRYPQP